MYHEAAIFEHVAKMSRMPESPRRKPSIPPVRFRPSIQPLSDLSQLPPTNKQPLIGQYNQGEESSESETENEPKRKVVKDTGSRRTPRPKVRNRFNVRDS